MAHLKDLIVTGAARILGKLYASEFVGKLTGTADNATKWNGYINDIGTTNSSDTWLLVAKNRSIQHRLATDFATSGHTHNYAGSSSAGGAANSANIVNGVYTGNGGSQAPSYVSGGNVRFNMMNCFKGLSSLPTYADTILMDTYTGSDVPYVTALGIVKSNTPRAFIAVGAKGNSSTWSAQAELVTSINYNNYAPTKTGGGASGTWGISVSGNAATATKLATARNIALTGAVTGNANFDGSGNISIATSVNHSHSYLALSGGTMGSGAYISWPDSGNWSNNNSGVTFPVDRGGFSWSGQSDGIRLYAEETSNDNLELVLRFTDDNSNGLSIRNSSGSQTARISANGVFSGSFSGNASTASSAATCTGNAATATKLATARTIALTGSVKGSGTFDGSGNLSIATTVNCGTTAPTSLANGQVYYVYEN